MPPLTEMHLNSVVALERADGVDGSGKEQYAALGSGVLVARPVPDEMLDEEDREKAEQGHRPHWTYLVTNWHVIEGHEEIYAKINVQDAARRFMLASSESGEPLWFSYEDYDVAVTFVRAGMLLDEEAEFTAVPEANWATVGEMEEIGLGAGDDVLACGFPLGLSGEVRKYTIVRRGAIARLDDEILSAENMFLLDCSVFPGHSGGPVFDKQSSGSGPNLLGIVSGYLPYEDVAISRQTGKPRVTFEENSGLAGVVPVDAIIGACDACRQASERVVDDADTLADNGG